MMSNLYCNIMSVFTTVFRKGSACLCSDLNLYSQTIPPSPPVSVRLFFPGVGGKFRAPQDERQLTAGQPNRPQPLPALWMPLLSPFLLQAH